MTRADVIKNWGVIEAIKNGEKVEMKSIGGIEWWSSLDPIFDFKKYEYRVKQKPEYAPFDFSDADDIIARVVKHKDSGSYGIITGVVSYAVYVNSKELSFDELLRDWEMINGDPCGKLKKINNGSN